MAMMELSWPMWSTTRRRMLIASLRAALDRQELAQPRRPMDEIVGHVVRVARGYETN